MSGRPLESGLADAPASSLAELLRLERLDDDVYRSVVLFDQDYRLYGGQVAAQALLAAGGTVPDGRVAHSLHGYFLREGDAAVPVVFEVARDHDGRMFSARRVVARQGDRVIFSTAVSFGRPADDAIDEQREEAPTVPPPDGLPVPLLPALHLVHARLPPQPYPDALWPTRIWVRVSSPLPVDPLWHAAAITYVSDASSGLGAVVLGLAQVGASIDHAVWFHRRARADDWLLVDLRPRTVGRGRGWYSGQFWDAGGALVASLAQEALFRVEQ
ncbi:acyl-CoA thioesterase [Cryptosporangium aurantiacum]|uniref:Acyl-CoA thioesterase-2 n=1 Tax=Cryptosporangium aurantiacum TaxID=134849 RepID=A0A1M7PHC1_9ACTN|nr:acyl-CoA thioesterase domain-containing protein [Cryptosporangium aurantiacum]SHN16441.1 acyl-CoA thioesterase-2 [Cryptosporangium aurantiacum]